MDKIDKSIFINIGKKMISNENDTFYFDNEIIYPRKTYEEYKKIYLEKIEKQIINNKKELDILCKKTKELENDNLILHNSMKNQTFIKFFYSSKNYNINMQKYNYNKIIIDKYNEEIKKIETIINKLLSYKNKYK